MNASRAFTLKYNTLLSIGRVQTPTLAILVKRRKEIENFRPEGFCTLTADFGDYTIDLTQVVTFADSCLLKVDASFGNITILLPRSVRLVKSSDTSFAAFVVTGDPDPDATQTIIIRADVNFGSVQVKYR